MPERNVDVLRIDSFVRYIRTNRLRASTFERKKVNVSEFTDLSLYNFEIFKILSLRGRRINIQIGRKKYKIILNSFR